MPLVVPAGFTNAIVNVTNSAGGISAASTVSLGLETPNVLTQTDADRVGNVFIDNLKGAWDNGWSVGPVEFYQTVAGGVLVFSGGTIDPGTATAAVYSPPSVALSCTKRTGLAGKAHRGRFFLPGVPETLVDEAGVVDSTYLTNINTLLSTLRTALIADAAVDDVVLFHDSSTPGSLDPDPITAIVARTPVANMRPRQRRS